ncbi:hypothetical protein SAY87_012548 [Trapa incisa]|uniref:RING-type E3 ubiquitin transferase n=1 Tax=Trapa incisa TaxID=236973 RepID=A0AAN7GL30_9MYRT|nr:hypothetical protein SAY87_012548 [Trapa incisa]
MCFLSARQSPCHVAVPHSVPHRLSFLGFVVYASLLAQDAKNGILKLSRIGFLSSAGKEKKDFPKPRMASANSCFDEMRSHAEVIDPPEGEDMMDIGESVSGLTQNSAKPNVSVSSSVRELLECPVCLNAMYPPIHQCSNGHTLCSGCKPRVHNRCPTCRHELGNIRCLALEKIAASLELPCKYQSFGCIGIYPYYSKLKHESQCSFRPYNCPYAGSECTVVGDIPYLVAHLKDDHKVDMHNGSTFNHRYVKLNPHEVENATWMLTVRTLPNIFSFIHLCI